MTNHAVPSANLWTLPPPPAAPRPSPWYQRPSAIGLMAFVAWPVAVVLVLCHPRWSIRRKLVVLLVVPFCLLTFAAVSLSTASNTSPVRPAVTSHR